MIEQDVQCELGESKLSQKPEEEVIEDPKDGIAWKHWVEMARNEFLEKHNLKNEEENKEKEVEI